MAGSGDKTLKVWNTAGECEHTLTGHDGAVLTVATTPQGWILSGGQDRTILIWTEKKDASLANGVLNGGGWERAHVIRSSYAEGLLSRKLSKDFTMGINAMGGGMGAAARDPQEEPWGPILCLAVLPPSVTGMPSAFLCGDAKGMLRLHQPDIDAGKGHHTCLHEVLTHKGQGRVNCITLLADGRVVTGANIPPEKSKEPPPPPWGPPQIPTSELSFLQCWA